MLVYRPSFNYGDRATLMSTSAQKLPKDIGLDPQVGMGWCFSAFHGPTLSADPGRLAAGPLCSKRCSGFGLFSFGQSSPCCRFCRYPGGFGIIVALFTLRFPGWSGGISLLSRATVALLQPVPGAGEGTAVPS